ncbi:MULTISPECIES: DUF6415 family natural product biosynthesis protein [unclassified Streptomyces]|uniref:DUF6415 family natural product biosynthesis protein n=1 Tax=unclassified Streptomyces TaxID=2593676 RepID=UPI00380FFE29
MTIATGLACTSARNDAVERADLGDLAFMERLVAALKESVAIDLVALAHVEDDIDAALGERAPTVDEITPRSLRLRSAVAQLVDIVMQTTDGRPQGDVAVAVLRACEALAERLPPEGKGLGHLRRLALAAQSLLDQGVIDDDVLDRAASSVGGEAAP